MMNHRAKPSGRLGHTLHRMWQDKLLYVMLLPALIYFGIFRVWPILNMRLAFFDYKARGPWVFAGLKYFKTIFQSSAFTQILQNTLIISFMKYVLLFPAFVIFALLLNELRVNSFRKYVQVVSYLPHFLSWVVVVAIFQQVLGGAGLINTWLRQRGHETLDIIGNPDLFIGLLTSQVMWKDTGWATILFLAALAGIDSTLYESSQVDGASRWRQLWHITLPGLRGIIILLLILRLGDSLTVGFEQIILQQRAVGREASEVLDTYVFNHGIAGRDWGEATAVGLVKGVVGTILVLGANKVAHLFGEQGVYKS